MAIVAYPAGAFVLAAAAALATRRPRAVAALGLLVWLAVATFWATRSDDDPAATGEPIAPLAGFGVGFVVVLLPWLVGATVGGLAARRR